MRDVRNFYKIVEEIKARDPLFNIHHLINFKEEYTQKESLGYSCWYLGGLFIWTMTYLPLNTANKYY